MIEGFRWLILLAIGSSAAWVVLLWLTGSFIGL